MIKAALLALVLLSPAPDAKEQVRRLLDAKPEERKALIDALVAAKPDPAEIAAALAAGRAYSADVPKGWLKRAVVAPDGKERPYLPHVPAKYDPARKYRLVLDMHGGVGRPDPLSHEELAGMREFWGEEAEAREWLLAFPAGDREATWWNGNGAGMVLRILDEIRRTWNVDEDAVFATGFSDGASGAFHLAAARATPFAGFLPLNGNPLVAATGGVPFFGRNLLNRPVYAVNTTGDTLYPSATLKPIFESLAALKAPLVWREIAGFGHDPGYLPEERPAILRWMDGVRRDPAPKVVWWEGVQKAPARIDWITVGGVTGGSGVDPFPDANPEIRETRVRLGVQLDEEFAGPGARITAVVDGSLAQGMDLRAGDLLLSVDGTDLPKAEALRAVLGKKAFGDALLLRLRRGNETLEKGVRIPEAKSRRAFPRDLPHGTLRAEAKGNRIEVTTLGIGSFEVWLSPRLVDLGKPVEIAVNGKTAFAGTVAPDLRFMLERGAEESDRSAVWWAKVPIVVPAK